MAGDALVLPPGTKMNAQSLILVLGIIGEIFQGGLFFGWSALSIMITDQGNFEDGCSNPDETIDDPGTDICKSQESKLALLWTLGAFSLNSGPILGGFALDYLGPKFVAIMGVCLNMLGLILFGTSSSSGFNAFIAAAIILGLGNITFHLAQFHISSLFPTKRGLITSVFVAGFTGSGTMMWFLQLIYEAAGSTKAAYMWVLIGYSFILALWIPLLWWMMPNDSFKVGEVYLLRDDWRFEKRLRGDLGRTYRRTTALQDYVANARLHEETLQNGTNGIGNGLVNGDSRGGQQNGGLRDIPHSDSTSPAVMGIVPDSADPIWTELAEATDRRKSEGNEREGQDHLNVGAEEMPRAEAGYSGSGSSTNPFTRDTDDATRHPDSPTSPSNVELNRRVEDAEVGHESMPLPSDVSYGPLVFESRRFVDLRKKSFLEQFRSTESLWMGVFYTLNVFFQQFYLGTQRLQLEHKGDEGHAYASYGQIVVAFAGFTIPVIAWLLDKKGYGVTLGTINAISVLSGAFMAIPWLWIQSVTLTLWMVGRYFMYCSYFAYVLTPRPSIAFIFSHLFCSTARRSIFGQLFGFKNFGKLVAVDNTINGLFGLLQVRKCHSTRPPSMLPTHVYFIPPPPPVSLDLLRHPSAGRQFHVGERFPGDHPFTSDVFLLQNVRLGTPGSGSHPSDGRRRAAM